ncbi:hypothetical protein ABIC16_002288 [Sphingomonas sp. PvP055]|uniref:PEPxxWA-CTERM sorting domain-containing protein n=1 Tax=Sphingomonas sp. PvP055 TaxID=3156391 RepID=UPI003397B20B
MKKLIVAALMLTTSAIAAPAMAAPVIYTFTGSFSGVNGGEFTDVAATFTGIGDTSTITNNGFSYLTPLTSLSAFGSTVGTFNILSPVSFYVNRNGYAGLYFSATNSYFSGQNNALLNYKGDTNFETVPISFNENPYAATFDTDRGSVTITNAANGTFAASVTGAVPEPATWAMMLAGFGMMGAGLRYRRRSTTAVYA